MAAHGKRTGWLAGAATAALALGAATVLGVGPAAATHLTSVTLDSGSAEVGTASVVLSGNVHSETDCGVISAYGWTLSSPNGAVSPNSQDVSGPVDTAYTLTVDTHALTPGVYNVSVDADWQTPGACIDGPDGIANATITITGRNGAFVCNAVAGRLGPGYEGNSNPAGTPCKDDSTFVKTLPLGSYVSLTGATSATDQVPNDINAVAPATGDSANAFAGAAGAVIRIGPVTIVVSAVSANATARCTAWHTVSLTSSSRVAGLSINGGAARLVTGYLKINVLGLVVVELNKVTLVGHTRTQQALVISSSLASGKLVIGEATAGYTGNPCTGVF